MGYSINELPESERPIEKLLEEGIENLTESELIALIIQTGLHGKNAKDIGKSIINKYSLEELGKASLDDIKDFRGIDNVKAAQIVSAFELAKRSEEYEKKEIKSSGEAKKLFRDTMSDLEQEELHAAYIAPNNKVISLEKIFKGSLKNLAVNKRDIVRKGLENNASAVILAHNHPMGDSNPTDKDVETTKIIGDSLKQFQMELLDHIIVGDNSSISMRERKLI